jgi:small nuclear ribonucleoprotein (snRNP)-like protein
MKSEKMIGSTGIILTVLVLVMAFSFPSNVGAKTKVVEIEGMSYNVESSMADNLKSLVGKKVYVSLGSGQTFAGIVKAVGSHLIHLEKIESKDYFDALLRIDNIIAIDVRFREVQR